MDWFPFYRPTDNFSSFVRGLEKFLIVQKFLYFTTDISLPFFSIREEKMSLHSRKWGHHDLQMLRFGELASAVAVRTHGDFGNNPKPL